MISLPCAQRSTLNGPVPTGDWQLAVSPRASAFGDWMPAAGFARSISSHESGVDRCSTIVYGDGIDTDLSTPVRAAPMLPDWVAGAIQWLMSACTAAASNAVPSVNVT